jgi:mannose-6-phosphate isomerase-like protein (cupin superfamily)
MSGSPEIIVGEEKYYPKQGEEFEINIGVKHRVNAINDDVVILEISTGVFDEDDIVRVEDKYGR